MQEGSWPEAICGLIPPFLDNYTMRYTLYMTMIVDTD